MQHHQEYSYQNGNEAVIVFVHGILGTPNQFRFLTEQLSHSYDCEALLLPGHGGTARDFSKTPGREWVGYAHRRIEEIRSRYKKLYLIGHSMGGLICLQYAAKNHIDGLVMINTPLAIKFGISQLAFKRKLYSNVKGNEILSVYRLNYGVTGARFYDYPLWIRQYMGLFGIMHQCRKCIGKVKAHTLIVQSALDETVHIKNANLLKRDLLTSEGPVYLPESHHAYFSPKDRETILVRTKEFLTRS